MILANRSNATQFTDTTPEQLDETNANDDACNEHYEHGLIRDEVERAAAIPDDQSVRRLACLIQIPHKEVNIHAFFLLRVEAELDARVVAESGAYRLHVDEIVVYDCRNLLSILPLFHSDINYLIVRLRKVALYAYLVRRVLLHVHLESAEVVGRYYSILLEAVRHGTLVLVSFSLAQVQWIFWARLVMLKPVPGLKLITRNVIVARVEDGAAKARCPKAIVLWCLSSAVKARLRFVAWMKLRQSHYITRKHQLAEQY